MKGGVSWVGESAEEELSGVVGREASGMGVSMAIRVKVKGEGRVGQEGVAKRVVEGNGRVESVENMLGGRVRVCMDLCGIVLDKWAVGVEGREM